MIHWSNLPWSSLPWTQEAVSRVLGYASILFWLFAQLPQVFVNWRNSSVEGLALPFLFNWLCGDVTNLVGCLLTDQLPFQTYLATYFTLIDLALMGQYIYYSRRATKRERGRVQRPHLTEIERHRQPHPHHHHHQHPHHLHHHHRRHSKSSLASASYHHEQPRCQHHSTDTLLHPAAGMAASWMTDRSASPGTLKRLAASRTASYSADSNKRRKRDSASEGPLLDLPPNNQQQVPSDHPFQSGGQYARSTSFDEPSPSEEHFPPEMIESFTSNASNRSSSTVGTARRGRRGGRSRGEPGSTNALPNLAGSIVNAVEDMRESTWSRERLATTSRRRGPSSSRTRSVVFLSIWTLVGLGRLLPYSASPRGSFGDLLIGHSRPSPIAWAAVPTPSTPPFQQGSAQALLESHLDSTPHLLHRRSVPSDEPADPPPIDYKRVIGRISAWTCVVFYLTSRMPQIWKNFTRRSTEGLSVLLFLAAFHGNLFYVASVLTSPLVQKEEGYLLESTPFLLGSGGTLAFDLMILFQACIYSKRASRIRGSKREGRRSDEEIAGLLAGDDIAEPRLSRQSTSRGRSFSGDRAIRNISASRARSVDVRAGPSNAWIGHQQRNPKGASRNTTAVSARSRSRSRRPNDAVYSPLETNETHSDSTA